MIAELVPSPFASAMIDGSLEKARDVTRGGAVATYDDLVALGDMKAVKAAGRQRLEGRDYVVRDGDILTIRSGV